MRMTWFMTRCVKGMHGKEKGLLMLSLLAFCGSYPSTFLRRTVTMVSRHWHLRKRTEEMERKTFKSHERDWEETNKTMLYDRLDLVGYKNTQKNILLDRDVLVKSTSMLMGILGVSDFKVDIWFCSESKIRHMNKEWRGVNSSTDVLSFPANEFIEAEVFDPYDPTLEFEKHLGDIVIAPNYVRRACKNDIELRKKGVLVRDEDKGCYKELGYTFDMEKRLPLLIIHGLLHLLGHDHESEKEWLLMTSREMEVIEEFRQTWSTRVD